MEEKKLYIVMVGLPARGKSVIASRLKENLVKDGIRTQIFNNGDLRRKLTGKDTSYPEFYHPENKEGVDLREKIALINIRRAKEYLLRNGLVAILDATNVSFRRREIISNLLTDHPLLFIECINYNEEILEASIQQKIILPEFNHLENKTAFRSFKQRISYYDSIYSTIRKSEGNYIKLDSLNNRIIEEEIREEVPYYERIRDFLVTDSIRNLFLIRHGETFFNLENRIGGNSCLTERGVKQAKALARYFQKKKIPVIFTSKKQRTIQTAEPIKQLQKNCIIIPLEEFNEIDAGVCECMTYEEIRNKMPDAYFARKKDKFNYIYENGEGYVTMRERVDRGIKKAIYLSSNSENIMIIGHRAVNRMILSNFLYRRKEDVPYIFVPQDKFYHIVATQDEKLFHLEKYETEKPL
ncbi:MAG TPA: 6-phosphofructo-2-kinase/fructose-2,6-bisphosphatase [Desulfobacteraceae bacterium]|nr:6-phosphofructo-2-kinase/fructose-2,6-bisphosphatase [Desulfobacteraceae bacterium]HPJ68474.1 6-phosphofructo-2-kinase/fructose-2,6-bisphosphatase [Desulfobacteraceae bacterium]HPQ28061.1 6-phosphofructo-2-kinase/fructose-2,6-bisphosphatase [Desulfobacteraceae bacterium]